MNAWRQLLSHASSEALAQLAAPAFLSWGDDELEEGFEEGFKEVIEEGFEEGSSEGARDALRA